MNDRLEDRPEYAWLRELKDHQGRELMRRHGAHGLGIGRKRAAGVRTDTLALIFYVEAESAAGAEPVPPFISYTPRGSDTPVDLPTDVVESPPAVSE